VQVLSDFAQRAACSPHERRDMRVCRDEVRMRSGLQSCGGALRWRGVVGLLQYIISVRPEQWPEGVHSDDDTETLPWHYFLFEMLIEVLPGMAVPS